MSPKRVDREQRKREIALTALDLFAKNGFEATSISQIAHAAGISKGAVYLYFESKDDLILHAVAAWIDQLISQTVATVSEDLSPDQRLRAIVRAMVESFIPDDRSVRISAAIFQLFLTRPDFVSHHDRTRDLLRDARRVITDVLLAGVSQGNFRPQVARAAESIAINLLAYLDGIALHYYMSADHFDLIRQVDLYLDHLLSDLCPPSGKRDET